MLLVDFRGQVDHHNLRSVAKSGTTNFIHVIELLETEKTEKNKGKISFILIILELIKEHTGTKLG